MVCGERLKDKVWVLYKMCSNKIYCFSSIELQKDERNASQQKLHRYSNAWSPTKQIFTFFNYKWFFLLLKAGNHALLIAAFFARSIRFLRG